MLYPNRIVNLFLDIIVLARKRKWRRNSRAAGLGQPLPRIVVVGLSPCRGERFWGIRNNEQAWDRQRHRKKEVFLFGTYSPLVQYIRGKGGVELLVWRCRDISMDFISIDVETANADLASICQIGVVRFKNGEIIDTWQTLIDPEDYFDMVNVSIHGIDEDTIADAPKFPDISDVLAMHISGAVVVSHTVFGRRAIAAAFGRYGIAAPQSAWLDTAKVVRRTWSAFSQRGYGLASVAEKLGIKFQHHNALEDARAAGEVLVHAVRTTGMTLAQWFERVKRPINESSAQITHITRQGNPEGPLLGEVVVFTGALSMPRREAADLAAAAGCEVMASVTKATTLLVVGDQDIRKFNGHEKSTKHRKAEELISKGQQIRILRETDFRMLVCLTQ